MDVRMADVLPWDNTVEWEVEKKRLLLMQTDNGLLGLSEDVLKSCIFSRIQRMRDVLSARSVCGKWRELVPSSIVNLRQDTARGSSLGFCQLLSSMTSLETLQVADGTFDPFGRSEYVTFMALTAAQHCRRLRSFHYSTANSERIAPHTLHFVISSLPSLQELTIEAAEGTSNRVKGCNPALSAFESFSHPPSTPLVLPEQLSLSLLREDEETVAMLASADKGRANKLRLELLFRPPLREALGAAWEGGTDGVMGFVSACTRLRSLSLQWNHPHSTARNRAMMDDVAMLGALEQLTRLHLSHPHWSDGQRRGHIQGIQPLPGQIENLQRLWHLTLKNMPVADIVPVTKLPELRELVLYHCEKVIIPHSISSLTCLHLLDINGWDPVEAQSPEIPSELGSLPSLKHLRISSRSLRSLPDSVTQLTSLIELDLMGCERLCELPSTLGFLTGLERVNIRGTGIKRMMESRTGPCALMEVLCARRVLCGWL